MRHHDPVDDDVVDLDDLTGRAFSGVALGREDLAALRTYSEDHASVSAGVFLAGDRAWIGFTDDPEEHLAVVRQRLNRPVTCGAFRATHSLHTLRALHAQINADHVELAALGIDVTMVGVSETANRLLLGIAAPLSDEQRHLLQERYPMALIVLSEGIVPQQAR